MRSWIFLQAELGNFHHRGTIFSFALKMSFAAVILSILLILVVMPPLAFLGVLPFTLALSISYSIALSWLLSGIVCGILSLIVGHAMHQLTVSRAAFEKLSRTDTLSGLLNRRAFTEALDNIDDCASLAIFDVDRFKAINDRFGHACGDAVIIAVSAILASAFDGSSVVARLGGEEFGVIVSGGDVEERLQKIEAVKAQIARRPIAADGCDISITISAGIADLLPGRSREAVYASADKALYLAKALGRNRVVHERNALNHAWHHHLVEGGLGVQGAVPDYDDTQRAYGI
ncbi:GGDEF domain-containing protein [Rhizobium sullae]|uniref:diguanylate cyclase n=1 Tax=Rhizobium sullae TaxID=50338 RepID=A0A4R3Q8Q0_RHISU|nr:GGDEF domain-containing protein [Rhizobium sullae]TCU14346.1 diguanylate cyclase (GGDEF)-like protein [Rhizobium sullae]